VNRAFTDPRERQETPKVEQSRYTQAMSEAFDWLMVKGLIAQDATQTGPNWVTRTRKGEEVAASSDGLRLLKVDELLAIELHPTLTAKDVREKFARGDVEDAPCGLPSSRSKFPCSTRPAPRKVSAA
jgi:hypothetical protein